MLFAETGTSEPNFLNRVVIAEPQPIPASSHFRSQPSRVRIAQITQGKSYFLLQRFAARVPLEPIPEG